MLWKLTSLIVMSACLMGCVGGQLPSDDPFYYYNEDYGNCRYRDRYNEYPSTQDRYYLYPRRDVRCCPCGPGFNGIYEYSRFRQPDNCCMIPGENGCCSFYPLPKDPCCGTKPSRRYYPTPRAEYRGRHEMRADELRGFKPAGCRVRYGSRVYKVMRVGPKKSHCRKRIQKIETVKLHPDY